MESSQEPVASPGPLFGDDHPWLEVPGSSIDEEIRYSLDEIRF